MLLTNWLAVVIKFRKFMQRILRLTSDMSRDIGISIKTLSRKFNYFLNYTVNFIYPAVMLLITR